MQSHPRSAERLSPCQDVHLTPELEWFVYPDEGLFRGTSSGNNNGAKSKDPPEYALINADAFDLTQHDLKGVAAN